MGIHQLECTDGKGAPPPLADLQKKPFQLSVFDQKNGESQERGGERRGGERDEASGICPANSPSDRARRTKPESENDVKGQCN